MTDRPDPQGDAEWLRQIATGKHGDVTLHAGMAAIRLNRIADRLSPAQGDAELIAGLRDWPATDQGDALSAGFVGELLTKAADRLEALSTSPIAELDARTVRLVIAAREVAFGGYFDGGDEHQQERIKELDQASEAFAADIPWDDQQ